MLQSRQQPRRVPCGGRRWQSKRRGDDAYVRARRRVMGNAGVYFRGGKLSPIFIPLPMKVIPQIIIPIGRRRQSHRSRETGRRNSRPRRGGRRSSVSGCGRAARVRRRRWRRCRVRLPCRRTGNKLEIERCQKGALQRNVARILGLVTDGANACTSEGSSPPALDALLAILCQPLEGCLPNLALAIGIGSGRCCRGNTRAGRVGGLDFLWLTLMNPS